MIASALTPVGFPASPAIHTAGHGPASSRPVPGATPASEVIGGGRGRRGFRLPLKNMLLYGTAGAILGVVFPMIPGGPVGGALIGAGLALLR